MGDHLAETVVPAIACIMMFGLPIVAVLASHQRKMAELMRQPQQGSQLQDLAYQIAVLRTEVQQLRAEQQQLAGQASSPQIPTASANLQNEAL